MDPQALTEGVFRIIVLIFSIVVHEVSHAAMANYLGDSTAKRLGRLTLNPIKHLDIWGSVIVPGFLLISGSSFLVGWAKPVPFNPYNLSNQRWGSSMVAIAGPLSNIIIATLFGALLRVIQYFPDLMFLAPLFVMIVFLNLLLAVFNLIPIPPLDGSKILFDLIGPGFDRAKAFLDQYGMVILFAIIFILPGLIFGIMYPVIDVLFEFLTGIPFFT